MRSVTLLLIALSAVSITVSAQNASQNVPAEMPSAAPEPTLEQIERTRIARERAQSQTELELQRQACYQKLAVTPCLNEAKTQHNEKMQDLKRQEVSLNDTRRRQAAAQRLADVDARNSPQAQLDKAQRRGRALEEAAKKQQNRQERAASRSTQAAPSAGPPSEQVTNSARPTPPRPGAKARDPVSASSKAAHQSDLAAQAAKNRQQALSREKAVQERRERASKREAERKKPAAASLPVPN